VKNNAAPSRRQDFRPHRHLARHTRDEAKKLIEDAGGKVAGRKQETDYVVAGEEAGSNWIKRAS